MLRKISTFLILLLISSSGYSIDKDLAYSLKCINYIKYYEKKMRFPQNTLLAISIHESGRPMQKYKRPLSWPWAVNMSGKEHYFDSKKEAVEFVKKNIREGKRNIDVGCMQVNLKYHPKAFKSIESAFNPKYNVGYAANFLAKKYKQTKSWSKAVAHYHSTDPDRGEKYRSKILHIAQNIGKYIDPYIAFQNERKKQMAINLSPKNIMDRNKEKSRIAFAKKSKGYKSNVMVKFKKRNSEKNA